MSDDQQNNKESKSNENTTSTNVATCSWWSPWLEAAKLKSSEVLQFVKNDLNEISTVVKSEATSVINSTTNVLRDAFMSKRTKNKSKKISSKSFVAVKQTYSKIICQGNPLKNFPIQLEEPTSKANTVKKSVSSFLDTVSNALNPMPEDDDQEALTIKNDTPVKLSSLQVKIHELIKNPDTFLLEIEESLLPQYNTWLEIVDDQLSTEKLTKQLVASPDLHNQYETLVPQNVSHILFWRRYLFRKGLLEDSESRREAREKRERQQVEQVQWEKEDFAQFIELSEEEQIRILTEYEKEKKKTPPEVKSKKSTKPPETQAEDLKMIDKKDLVIVGDTGSSQVSSTSSSGDTESKDTVDDWERDFELEDAEVEGSTGTK